MEKEKRLTMGYLTIIVILMAVLFFLLSVVGDCKESCESYYDVKIQKECFEDAPMEVVQYDVKSDLFDSPQPSG